MRFPRLIFLLFQISDKKGGTSMKKDNAKLYRFLQAAAGNWRNAIFIECENCTRSCVNPCPGFLLVSGADGAPILLTAEWFREQTGEQVDKDECAAVLSRAAFESACSLWLKWRADDATRCALLQVTD